MKNKLITLLLSVLFTNTFAQEFRYEVRGKYDRPVTKEVLVGARTLGDFIHGFPVNWISSYVSVEIVSTHDGKTLKALSPTDLLSEEQKSILRSADLADDFTVTVKYKFKEPVSGQVENNEIYVNLTVVPEVEAEYIGGKDQMKKYIAENAINKIPKTIPQQVQPGFPIQAPPRKVWLVLFTVSETGEIINARMSKTTGDQQIDKLLLETITKMPKWKPAENSKGIKVKQEFEFGIHQHAGDGC